MGESRACGLWLCSKWLAANHGHACHQTPVPSTRLTHFTWPTLTGWHYACRAKGRLGGPPWCAPCSTSCWQTERTTGWCRSQRVGALVWAWAGFAWMCRFPGGSLLGACPRWCGLGQGVLGPVQIPRLHAPGFGQGVLGPVQTPRLPAPGCLPSPLASRAVTLPATPIPCLPCCAELVLAGNDLRRDREAHELLVHSLALPLWRPPETQQHWAVRRVAQLRCLCGAAVLSYGACVAVLLPRAVGLSEYSVQRWF